MKGQNLIALTVMAVVLLLVGQYLLARSCFLIDSQEMLAILGADSFPNCDCTSTGGTTCGDPFPSNCTTSSDCVGCNDTRYDEACNAYDAWDAAACTTDPDETCTPKMQGECAQVSGNWVCINGYDLEGVACDGEKVVKQCHY